MSNATLTKLNAFPDDWPELEYVCSASASTLESSTSEKQYAAIGSLLIASNSIGNMTIRSASMFDRPIINPNWLVEEADQEVAIQAYRRTRQAWQIVDSRIGEEVSPGMNVTSDADLLAHIKMNIAPIHHASSSCKMGKEGDADAVVDSRGRVIGVYGLKVIDSSSFRFTPPGHTQAATYAHAEKLVDDILMGR